MSGTSPTVEAKVPTMPSPVPADCVMGDMMVYYRKQRLVTRTRLVLKVSHLRRGINCDRKHGFQNV